MHPKPQHQYTGENAAKSAAGSHNLAIPTALEDLNNAISELEQIVSTLVNRTDNVARAVPQAVEKDTRERPHASALAQALQLEIDRVRGVCRRVYSRIEELEI